MYKCRCKSTTDGTFDPLYISFGGYSYEVGSESYIHLLNINGNTFCIPYVQESKDPLNSTVILGQPFLKNFNVYYDMENKQIGLYGKRTEYAGGPYASTCDGNTKGDNTEGEGGEDIKEESGIIIGTIKQLLGSLTQLGLIGILFIASLILNLIFICIFYWNRNEEDEKDDKEEPLIIPRGDFV